MNRNGTYQSPVPEGIVITSRSGYEGIILLAQVLESDGKWVSLAVYDHCRSARALICEDDEKRIEDSQPKGLVSGKEALTWTSSSA
jgi:hypothetical protein